MKTYCIEISPDLEDLFFNTKEEVLSFLEGKNPWKFKVFKYNKHFDKWDLCHPYTAEPR